MSRHYTAEYGVNCSLTSFQHHVYMYTAHIHKLQNYSVHYDQQRHSLGAPPRKFRVTKARHSSRGVCFATKLCSQWFNRVWCFLQELSLPLLKSLQSCPTLCGPTDYSPSGSSVYGILQARVLEWVATSFSRGSSWPKDQTRVSYIAGRFFKAEP